ncbi:MAG: hypothetical protein EXS55_00255 [Candidatus Magasanikbacteria bacterium]|nr:hypothetical protein [Candidatus Magasanikbacteria bacterium]
MTKHYRLMGLVTTSLGAALLLGGGGCGSTPITTLTTTKEETKAPVVAMSTFANSKYHFEIQYPSDWMMNDKDAATAVKLFSPLESAADTFRENINVIEKDYSQYTITLDQYFQLNLKDITAAPNFKQVESKNTTIAGQPAKKLVFMATLDDQNLEFLQYYILKDKRTYIITCTTPPDTFKKFTPTCEKLIGTFKLK